MRVAVIGGGPAGLTAALAAAKGGCRVTVLEASPVVGGLAGSFGFAGFQVDYGPHRLHLAAAPRVLALYKEALRGPPERRKRRGLLHLDGRRLPYPLTPLGALRGLGALELARHTASAVWARLFPPRGDSFLDEASRRVGRRAARLLYGPAARKVWGVEPTALEEAQARTRVRAGGIGALLAAALGRRGKSFLYPPGGMGALAKGLAVRIRELGGEVLLGARAEGLELERGRIAAVRVSGRAVEAEAVVATNPLPELCAWVGAREAARGLGYRAVVLVYLALGLDSASSHDVHYFAGEEIPPSRLFEPRLFSMSGPRGRTVVGLDIPCQEGDATFRAGDAELLSLVRPALERIGLCAPEVLEMAVRRHPHAYPVYRRGFQEARGRALEAVGQVEGLYPAGRHALFVHDNVHHACAVGLACGEAVARRASSRDWRRLQPPFLEARVED